MRKRFLCLLLGLLCLTALLPARGRAADAADVRAIADGIVAWKKADNGATADGFLLNDAFLALAGTTPGDWYPIGLSRLGVEDRYDAYLAVLRDQVEERYRQPGALSAAKATEWHRAVVAIAALGGDPEAFGVYNGAPIDLIADGSYACALEKGPGGQGINGWIWGLIALDTGMYAVPADAKYTRETFITEILKMQLTDGVNGNAYGGWVLGGYGSSSDVDITAMAIQALAPYYNDDTVYTYVNTAAGTTVSKTVRQCVDEALDRLRGELFLDGEKLKPVGVELLKREPEKTILRMTLTEGRNRQIRRMCELVGVEVIRLKRVSEGGIRLADVKSGQWRHLTEQEVAQLKEIAGMTPRQKGKK